MSMSINIEEYERRNRECSKIQEQYDFEIPKYILSTLIKKNYDKVEVVLLINMAVMNERFTEEEGKLLKSEYCFK